MTDTTITRPDLSHLDEATRMCVEVAEVRSNAVWILLTWDGNDGYWELRDCNLALLGFQTAGPAQFWAAARPDRDPAALVALLNDLDGDVDRSVGAVRCGWRFSKEHGGRMLHNFEAWGPFAPDLPTAAMLAILVRAGRDVSGYLATQGETG